MKKIWLSLLVISILLIGSSANSQEHVILDKQYNKIEHIDDIAANSKEYFAWALEGTAYNAARWCIMRITYDITNPATFVVEFADGDQLFDNKVSEYGLLTYS